jgi:biopolymer transport protein ExbD
MKFEMKRKLQANIPTATMSDIVFMLILFFLTVSVLKNYTGLPVILPDADLEVIRKIESRRHTGYLWIDKSGAMSYNDKIVGVEDNSLYSSVYDSKRKDPQLWMFLQYDSRVRMEIITKANNELRKATAIFVNFATTTKQK